MVIIFVTVYHKIGLINYKNITFIQNRELNFRKSVYINERMKNAEKDKQRGHNYVSCEEMKRNLR